MKPPRMHDTPRGRCAFCHADVTEQQPAAFPVQGWEIERGQGGANRILNRTRVPGYIAHKACAESYVKRGRQGALV